MPANVDASFFNGRDSLVEHYMRYTLIVQYLFAHNQPKVSNFILESIHLYPSVFEAACLLSKVHQSRLQKSAMENTSQYLAVQRLIGAIEPSEGEAMAGLHVVSSFLFSGGTGEWEKFLQVAILYSKGVLGRYSEPTVALMNCSEPERFIIKTSMWFDVLASISHSQEPSFMEEYRQLFGRSSAYIEGPISLVSPMNELSMMPVMGCENHILWAMAEISWLAVWKQREWHRGCLSMPELVERGKDIERYLIPERPVDPSTLDSDPEHFTSEIFRASSRVYLHSVISGDFPYCPEIKEGVQETINILQMVPEPHRKSRHVVRSVVFSIFICGCLTDDVNHRDYLLHRLEAEELKEPVGNCGGVKSLIEEVWSQRANEKTKPVRWREALKKAAMLLV